MNAARRPFDAAARFLFGRATLLLPDAFRREWGSSMRRTFDARLADHPGSLPMAFLVAELGSLLVVAAQLRLAGPVPAARESIDYFAPADTRPYRVAWLIAIAFHILLFATQFPAGGPELQAQERDRATVIRIYVPPPPPEPEPEQKRVRRTARPVPIPDPDPFDPEPLVAEETYETTLTTEAPFAAEFLVGEPAGPPPTPRSSAARVGVDVRRPKLLYQVRPEYPELARRARLECPVIIEARIDRTGSVADARVVKGCGLGLNEAALQAVSRWRYEPTQVDGRPVEVLLSVTVNFRLQ